MKIINQILLLLVIWATIFTSCGEAMAQQRTVGDGTAFIFNQGKSESYGIGGGDVGGFQAADYPSGFTSRHHRTDGSTGIGSSTLQTTSATSESTPRSSASFELSPAQFNLPQRQSTSNFLLPGPNYSALQNPINNGLRPLYSESATFAQPGNADSLQNIDAVPSFNRRGSGFLPMADLDSSFFKRVEPRF